MHDPAASSPENTTPKPHQNPGSADVKCCIADPPKHEPRPLALPLALAGLFAIVYLWACPTAIQAGDGGEFSTVMLGGGVPHPSGYPWMRLLGPISQGLTRLGVGPVYAAACIPALMGAAGAGLFAWTAGRFDRAGPWLVALVALAPVTVVHVADAEVWGPQLAFCGVFVAAATQPRARRPGPFWLGALLGLATSHHLLAVTLTPLAIGAAWPGRDDDSRVGTLAIRGARALALGLAGSALGLMAFFTLMVPLGGDAWSWGDTSTLSGLWHHVSRGDYGTTSLSLHEDDPELLSLLARQAGSAARVVSIGAIEHPAGVLLLLGALAAAARPEWLERSTWWGLCAAVVTSGPIFCALGNIDPASVVGAWILERFDLLFLAVASVVASTSVGRLRRKLDALPRLDLGRVRVALLALGPVALAAQLLGMATRPPPREQRMVETYAHALLESLPEGAVVFGTDDHRTFPVLFAQEVQQLRPDVLYVDASLLSLPWYRQRLADRRPELPFEALPLQTMGVWWSDETLRDTPIYLANVFSRPAAGLPRVPEGLAWRVVAPHRLDVDEPAAAVAQRHLAALERVEPAPDVVGEAWARAQQPSPAHPFAADLAAAYARPSLELIGAMRAQGQDQLAAELEARLQELLGTQ